MVDFSKVWTGTLISSFLGTCLEVVVATVSKTVTSRLLVMSLDTFTKTCLALVSEMTFGIWSMTIFLMRSISVL